MLDLIRRSRGFAIALVVLALSAGAVFAGGGRPVSLPSSPTADEQQGAQGDEGQSGDQETEAPETEAPETEAPATQTPDTPDSRDTTNTNDNHGALVSQAAQMPTPDGFDNHGDFVRCVAHMKDVSAVGFDWTTVTKDSCDPTTPTTTTDGTANPLDGKQKPNDGKPHGQDGKQKHPNHGKHH